MSSMIGTVLKAVTCTFLVCLVALDAYIIFDMATGLPGPQSKKWLAVGINLLPLMFITYLLARAIKTPPSEYYFEARLIRRVGRAKLAKLPINERKRLMKLEASVDEEVRERKRERE